MVLVAVLLGPEDEERRGKIAAATKNGADVLRIATADLHPELRKRLDTNSSAAAAGDKRAAGAAKADALAEDASSSLTGVPTTKPKFKKLAVPT